MTFAKYLPVFLLLLIIFGSNVTLAQESLNNVTTHPTGPPTSTPNPGSSHVINPANLTFNKGLEKAREIVASKTQFKLIANTSNPSYIWGDKNYAVQNDIQLSGIVEYNDSNSNHQYDANELVQSLDLNKFVSWNFSQEIITDNAITFSLISNKINQPTFEKTQLNFTQSIISNDNFMKFDISIVNWPWVSSNDRIGIIFNFVLQDNAGVVSGFHFHQKQTTNGTSIDNGLFVSNEQNQTTGYFLSSQDAIMGQNDTLIPVSNQFIVNSSNKTALLILNYPYFSSYLFHDPIIGSNGDTFIATIYSLLLGKSSLIIITTALTVLSLLAIFVMRRR